MTIEEIHHSLKEKFGEFIGELVVNPPSDSYINVEAEKLLDVCFELRDNPDFAFDYLMCLSGVEFQEQLMVVYHLCSMSKNHKVVLKASLPKDNLKISSVERVWRSADWHEREAYDLFGIIFEGHHNLIRILLPYDWEGYPLRKDYKEPETYHGIKVPY